MLIRIFSVLLALYAWELPAVAQEEPSSSGSGFFVSSDGWLITNAHVVKDCTRISVAEYGDARIGAIDKTNDLAALKVKSTGHLRPVSFRSSQPRLGEDIVALGYPLAGLLSSSIKITTGNINAIAGIDNDTRFLQISAPIQPGNSGGPLVDRTGRVIGINTGTLAKAVSEAIGQNTQNVNFSLRFSVIQAFLSSQDIPFTVNSAELPELKTAEIAEKLVPGTVQILCYGDQDIGPEQDSDAPNRPVTAEQEPTYGPMREAFGYDVIGFDYTSIKGTSYSECRQRCMGDTRCNAITYNRKYSVCFLKSDAAILVRNGNAIAAYKPKLASGILITDFSIYADRDATGGDYRRLRNVDFVRCTVECMKDYQCRAFAYVRRKNECWLKNRVTPVRVMKGVELGLK